MSSSLSQGKVSCAMAIRLLRHWRRVLEKCLKLARITRSGSIPCGVTVWKIRLEVRLSTNLERISCKVVGLWRLSSEAGISIRECRGLRFLMLSARIFSSRRGCFSVLNFSRVWRHESTRSDEMKRSREDARSHWRMKLFQRECQGFR